MNGALTHCGLLACARGGNEDNTDMYSLWVRIASSYL